MTEKLTSKLILEEIVGKQFLTYKAFSLLVPTTTQTVFEYFSDDFKNRCAALKENLRDYEDNDYKDYEKLLKEFCDPKKWKRETKERMGHHAKYGDVDINVSEDLFRKELQPYECISDSKGYCNYNNLILDLNIEGDGGYKNVDLIIEAAKLYRSTGKRPWNRVFIPQNDTLSDAFRLEVFTNYDDTDIIAWCIIED